MNEAVLVRRPGPRPRVQRLFTARQADQARLAIEDGAFAWSGHAGVWRVVGSDGQNRYLASPDGCNCKAGLHGRRCWHSAVAMLLNESARDAANEANRHYRNARKGNGVADNADWTAGWREWARAATSRSKVGV